MAEAIRSLRSTADEVPLPAPDRLARLPAADPRRREIRHPALIGYLRERGIDPAVPEALCREVHDAVGERRFFAIGFRNDAGGWNCAARNSREQRPEIHHDLRPARRHTALLQCFFDLLLTLHRSTRRRQPPTPPVLNSVAAQLPRALPFSHATRRSTPATMTRRRLTLERLRQRPARCDRHTGRESYRAAQGSEPIAPTLRKGFPHAASSRPQVVTSPAMTPEPSPPIGRFATAAFPPRKKP